MSIEKSHGRARPTLPRSRDLAVTGTVHEPSTDRAAAGRFARGNAVARDRGPKRVITKATDEDGLAAEEAIVARDTRKLLHAILRELPSAGVIVRGLAYSHAREVSLAAYYDAAANRAGLATDLGMRMVDRASHHRQRAERLSVTLLDESSALAKGASTPALVTAAEVAARVAARRARLEAEPAIEVDEIDGSARTRGDDDGDEQPARDDEPRAEPREEPRSEPPVAAPPARPSPAWRPAWDQPIAPNVRPAGPRGPVAQFCAHEMNPTSCPTCAHAEAQRLAIERRRRNLGK